jgi:hypothetical protein
MYNVEVDVLSHSLPLVHIGTHFAFVGVGLLVVGANWGILEGTDSMLAGFGAFLYLGRHLAFSKIDNGQFFSLAFLQELLVAEFAGVSMGFAITSTDWFVLQSADSAIVFFLAFHEVS